MTKSRPPANTVHDRLKEQSDGFVEVETLRGKCKEMTERATKLQFSILAGVTLLSINENKKRYFAYEMK